MSSLLNFFVILDNKISSATKQELSLDSANQEVCICINIITFVKTASSVLFLMCLFTKFKVPGIKFCILM